MLMLELPAWAVLLGQCLANLTWDVGVRVLGWSVFAAIWVGAGGLLPELDWRALPVLFVLAVAALFLGIGAVLSVFHLVGATSKNTQSMLFLPLQGVTMALMLMWSSVGPVLAPVPLVGLFATWDAFHAGGSWLGLLALHSVYAVLLIGFSARIIELEDSPWRWLRRTVGACL